jgi:hypothetical protein
MQLQVLSVLLNRCACRVRMSQDGPEIRCDAHMIMPCRRLMLCAAALDGVVLPMRAAHGSKRRRFRSARPVRAQIDVCTVLYDIEDICAFARTAPSSAARAADLQGSRSDDGHSGHALPGHPDSGQAQAALRAHHARSVPARNASGVRAADAMPGKGAGPGGHQRPVLRRCACSSSRLPANGVGNWMLHVNKECLA